MCCSVFQGQPVFYCFSSYFMNVLVTIIVFQSHITKNQIVVTMYYSTRIWSCWWFVYTWFEPLRSSNNIYLIMCVTIWRVPGVFSWVFLWMESISKYKIMISSKFEKSKASRISLTKRKCTYRIIPFFVRINYYWIPITLYN